VHLDHSQRECLLNIKIVHAGPLPAIFGLNIATYVLCEMAGKPIANPLPIKNRRKLYERLLRELAVRESKVAGEPDIVR
jgi:hypothetical protein